MAIKDDVTADLAAAYPRLSRSDVERVDTLLSQAPAADRGASIAAALKPLLPEMSDRIGGLSADDVTDYLRLLQGAVTTTLQSWKNPEDAPPAFEDIRTFIDTVEG